LAWRKRDTGSIRSTLKNCAQYYLRVETFDTIQQLSVLSVKAASRWKIGFFILKLAYAGVEENHRDNTKAHGSAGFRI
jgi:hypothetical protein